MSEIASKQFVFYARVSTQKQGQSGLGLEAQTKMVDDYVARIGGTIIARYVEIESGKSAKNRPELQKALAHAKKSRAVLCVAKLDRLARQVSFVSNLLDSGVDFRAADFPEANRMLIQLLSVFAEYEASLVSQRTKAALAARKARGFALGRQENFRIGNNTSADHNRQDASAEALRLKPVLDDIEAAGIDTIRGQCEELRRRGYRTARGLDFHPTQIMRIRKRIIAA